MVLVNCDEQGDVDVADLRQKAADNADNLSCLMITYPSTHGVYEERYPRFARSSTSTVVRCTWMAPT